AGELSLGECARDIRARGGRGRIASRARVRFASRAGRPVHLADSAGHPRTWTALRRAARHLRTRLSAWPGAQAARNVAAAPPRAWPALPANRDDRIRHD